MSLISLSCDQFCHKVFRPMIESGFYLIAKKSYVRLSVKLLSISPCQRGRFHGLEEKRKRNLSHLCSCFCFQCSHLFLCMLSILSSAGWLSRCKSVCSVQQYKFCPRATTPNRWYQSITCICSCWRFFFFFAFFFVVFLWYTN